MKPGAFNLKDFCHPKQYEAVTDQAPYADFTTSRRSGKTTGCAADLLNEALQPEDGDCLYITLTRQNAKILLWPTIKKIDQRYRLKGQVSESELAIKYPNSTIYLAGANDLQAIEKFRGLKLKKVYIDEPQSLRRNILEKLIDEILGPALIDCNGKLRLSGTPGAVPVGYFYDAGRNSNWSHHHWTIWDNPYIKNPDERLKLELKRRGVTADDPSIQREWFGRWVMDLEALVIQYRKETADYDTLPEGIVWEHIISVDLGYEDSDAISVINFSDKCPSAYLTRELVKNKQGVTELANQLDELVKELKPLKIVMDTGGLGKKIAEEIRRRYGIPVEAADKVRKLEYIELLNDALRTGRLRAKSNSLFAQDAMLLEWDRDNPEKPKISDRFHSDIVDSVLYGFRESLHWLYETPKVVPAIGTPEHLKEEERKIWEGAIQSWEAEKEHEKFWKDPFD